MRCKFAALALAGMLLMPALAKAQSWEEYRPKGIGFRIEMPGKPKIETAKTNSGTVTHRALATVDKTVFMVNYADKNDITTNPDLVLDAVIKGQAEDKKVLGEKKDMIGGLSARRIKLEDADKDQYEIRVVIIKNRLVQALFLGPVGDPLGKRFLDSLTVTDE
ncbi:MAG TPA: hypothetical protein VHD14_10295 [Pseudolabrys sp.]|nr:hypothetical protein [Pseudolabrys sp.]